MFTFYKTHQKIFLILVAACLLIYLKSIGNGYNLDDELVTINHPLTTPESGLDLQAIFTSPYSIQKFGYTYGYRPVVHLSFALEHQLFGESPSISHFFNLVLYVITVLFLAYFLTEWLGSQHFFVISLGSFIFAIHPLHVEVVASIKNRDELLAFLFALFAMHFYLRQVKIFQFKYSFLMLFFAILALLSKKTAIPLLILIPILDIIYYQRLSRISFLLWQPILLLLLWVGLDFNSNFNLIAPFYLLIIPIIYFLWDYVPKWFLIEFFKIKIWKWLIVLFICSIILLLSLSFNVFWSLLIFIPSVYIAYKAEYPLLILVSIFYFILAFYFKNAFFTEVVYLSALFLFKPKIQVNKYLKIALFLNLILAVISSLWIVSNLYYLLALPFFGMVFWIFSRKKIVWALLLTTVQTIFVLSIGFYSFSLLYLSALLFLTWLSSLSIPVNLQKNRYILLGVFVISFGILKLPKPQIDAVTKIDKQMLISQSNQVSQNKGVKEGRPLEYVENPLVYHHTNQEKLATGLHIVGSYMKLHLFPYPLRYYYGYKTSRVHNIGDLATIFNLALVLITLLSSLLYYKKERLYPIAILLFIIPLILASNWFVLIAGMIAERHTYASTIGFSILIALLIGKLKISNWGQLLENKTVGILFLLIVVGYTSQSFMRVSAWSSAIKLMETDAKSCSSSAHANSLLATAYIKSATEDSNLSVEEKQNHIDKAIFYMKRSIRIFPYLFNYHFDLGRFYVLDQDYHSAYRSFKNAHQLMPENPLALDELVKCSFDLNFTDQTLIYGKRFYDLVGPQESMLELMAYQALTTQDYLEASKWAKIGKKHFPLNTNFARIEQDAKMRRIVHKSN